MELFKLLGTIAVQNQGAVDAISETTGHAEKAESKMSKNFAKIGDAAAKCGKAIATGLAAGVTAMSALTVKALNLSGELEQNMGGSEAVFKEHAENLQEIAKDAFANMGLSTADYLGTANKMGALFQGAGFTIEESMGLATSSMQRAADVASIMGISVDSAMEAVAGAAKGNFTMMDNLGVAMNETTLEAYALAKGVETAYKDMTNQEKIGLAMELFLEKTAYATGNYAKENETLAGSLTTAKAALTNFLDGSGDVDGLVTSFTNAADVIVENVNNILPRLVTGVVSIINKIVPMIPPLLQSLLPGILDGAIQLIEGLVAAMPTIVSAIMDILPSLIKGVERIFVSLVSALPSIVQTLVNAFPGLIPMLINSIASMLLVLMHYLPQIVQPIADALPDIIVLIIDTLMDNLPALIDGLVKLVVAIVRATPQIIVGIIQAIPQIISSILVGLWNALPVLIMGIVQIVKEIGLAIWELIGPFATKVAEWFAEFFGGIWEKIKEFVAPIAEFFKNLWTKIVDTFHMVIDPWIEIAKRAFVKVKEFFEPIIENIKEKFVTAVEKIKEVFAPVADFFKGVWSGIKTAFGSVADWFKDVFSKAWQNVKEVFSKGGQVFSGIKEGLEKTFKTVVNKLISGINTIIKKPFEKLNELITKLKGINILGVSPFTWMKNFNIPQIPQLEKGGVLKKGQIGLLEGNGAEAVVPLEKNTGWLDKIAERLNSSTDNGNSREVVNKLNELIELMKALKIYLYGDVLVGELAPAMDAALGTIYTSKGRGN